MYFEKLFLITKYLNLKSEFIRPVAIVANFNRFPVVSMLLKVVNF